jgi:hypothetical protein
MDRNFWCNMMYQNVVSVPVCVDKSGHKSGKDFELEIYSAKILSLPPFHTTKSIAFDSAPRDSVATIGV